MAYLVKETITAAPRPYVLDGIISDYRLKLLTGDALVRDDRQEFWYSVGELIGEVPTSEFRFVCPNCKNLIQGRKIDVGLPVKCSRCSQSSVAPDVKAQRSAVLDKHVLKQANATLRNGAFLFVLGAGTTIASYTDAMSRGGGPYGVFWGLIVIGLGMMMSGFNQRRLHLKRYPQKTK